MSRRIADWDGPRTGFTITDAVTFLDTVTLYGWRPLPKGVLGVLRQQYGRRLIYKRHKLRGRPQACSWHLTLHQPSRATLMDLMAIQPRRFVVHAVEIPTDFITPDRQQADLATTFLTRGLVQKWRRRDHRSQPYLNSLYWKRDRKAARNIGLYGDRQSKTGLGSCSHLELRFTGSKACKRAGLGELRNLIRGVDPMKLLNRQARLVFIDPKRLDVAVDRIARANLRLDQRRSRRRRRSSQRRSLQVDRWRRRPNTLSGMQEYVKRWLVRCLRDEELPLDVSTLATARSQNLWDHAPGLLRGCLTKRTNWTDFTPIPRWWWW
jgi:hypothetical protein